MGSIGAEVFCNILRVKDEIYTSNISATNAFKAGSEDFRLKDTLGSGSDRIYSPFCKYYDDAVFSNQNNTPATAYDYGAAMAVEGVEGVPGQTQFSYQVTAGAPLLAGAAATITLWLKDSRPKGGFVNQATQPSTETTVFITSGDTAGWWEVDVQPFGDAAETDKNKLVFTNRGAADFVGFLQVSYSQAVENHGSI
tara:strand:+ start:1284 stop:1871 length:588 start_codon:yes stop_codon:yes gene_type:complete